MIAEAPCRADFAGGTLDIWPLGLLHDGALTVNAAIPVAVRLEIDIEGPTGEVWHAVGDDTWRKLSRSDEWTDLTAAVAFAVMPVGGVRVRVLSQASLGSGLGGSSAYGVALARGILIVRAKELADHLLVGLVRDLEARILGVPTGAQDHWAAVRGGVLALHVEAGGDRIEALDVDPEWLGERMTVFDTGIAHHSGMVNWEVIRRRLEGDEATVEALEAVSQAAQQCRQALLEGDQERVGQAIASEWWNRRILAPEVCPPELETVVVAGLSSGAAAVKACGAGGGGSVLVWHHPGARDEIVAALMTAAPTGRVVATGIETTGCRVLYGE